MNTYMPNEAAIERKWYVVDAAGLTLGRLASEVAKVLRGKNKPIFTPHADTGDYVIVVNADKIVVTGKKLDQKIYYRHSDYVGGMKEATLREKMQKAPVEVVETEAPAADTEAPAEGGDVVAPVNTNTADTLAVVAAFAMISCAAAVVLKKRA